MDISLQFSFKNKSTTQVSFKLCMKALVAVLILFMTGCGGSSSSDGFAFPEESSLVGVFFGDAIIADERLEKVVVAISPEGKAIVYSEASNDMLIAHGSITDVTFKSEDTMFYPGSSMTREGSMEVSIDGDKLVGSATVSGMPIFIDATYLPAENNVSLADIRGNYVTSRSSAVDNSVYTRSIAIDSDGIISGSDTNGCLFSGFAETISEASTLFNVTIKAESCFEDFEYKGLLAYGVFPFDIENVTNNREGIVIASEMTKRAYVIRQFSLQN